MRAGYATLPGPWHQPGYPEVSSSSYFLKVLREIWEERGFEGVSILLQKSEMMASLVGGLMTGILTGRCEASEFVKSCLHATDADNESAYKPCLTGFLWKADYLLSEIARKNGGKVEARSWLPVGLRRDTYFGISLTSQEE